MNEVKLLDHGYLRLVDCMPAVGAEGVRGLTAMDSRVVAAARVSNAGVDDDSERTGDQDRKLVRYMMLNGHSSPFEQVQLTFAAKMPIFVARQWVRHRTACVVGGTVLSFDLPAGKTGSRMPRHYPLTVKQVFERWQPTVNQEKRHQKDPLFKRRRVMGMRLRCLNEDTGEFERTTITDVWSNGVKSVLRAKFSNGSVLRATADHRVLTESGWMPFGEALARGLKFAGAGHATKPLSAPNDFSSEELGSELWAYVSGPVASHKYEVSTLGRVRSWENTRGVRFSRPALKRPTLSESGYHVVSLSAGSKSRTHLVHRLVVAAFRGESGEHTRHIDGCRTNNRLANLQPGTAIENAADRVRHGTDMRLSRVWVSVEEWQPDGEEEVFDLSVASDWHNFVADGVVVHNCINEISARYAKLPCEFYVPAWGRFQAQSASNKQASDGLLSSGAALLCDEAIRRVSRDAYSSYEVMLAAGLARELARMVLPTNFYTEWYWSANLHNTFHFLKLRTHEHAQHEIRVYAEAMLGMLRELAPVSVAAWEERRGS